MLGLIGMMLLQTIEHRKKKITKMLTDDLMELLLFIIAINVVYNEVVSTRVTEILSSVIGGR